MDKKKALVLVNKKAGTGKAGDGLMKIVTRLTYEGYEPIVYPVIPHTEFVSENLLAEYDGKIQLVVCSGGDGTLNHVMQGVMQMKQKPIVGYIPAGSTNDFARSLHIPVDFDKALDIIVSGRPFTYDVGKMNGKYFNYVVAFGAFSAVSYATKQELKNVFGHAAYILSGIGELYQNINYSCHMKIEIDGEVQEGDYIFGAVCNSTSIGGMKFLDSADVSLNDGKMELILIPTPKNVQELSAVLFDLKNNVTNSNYIIYRTVTDIKFISDEHTAWSLDGEFGGKSNVTEISIVPDAITIMTE